MIKKTIITLTCLLFVSGCESMDSTEKGVAVGTVTGAGIGGIIGHQNGHGGNGALIGGAAGALAGGLLGHRMDQRQKEINPEHITIRDIAKMGDEGVPSSAIIDEIKRTKSIYNLDTETINYLREHKISDKVIDYMMATNQHS